MREKKLAALGLAFITAFSLAGCGSAAATGTASSSVASSAAGKTAASGKSSGDDKAPLIVGSKDFTESIVLGEIYAEAFEDNDVPVKRQLKLGSQVIHDSIKAGDVEFYPEYTGTGLIGRCLCHEYDHLDGILYTDKAVRMLDPDEYE